MKKILTFIIAAALVLSLAACTGTDTPAADTADAGTNTELNAGTNTESDTADSGAATADDELPDYTHMSEGLDERGFFADVDIQSLVKLPEYKNIPATRDLVIANADEVQEEIKYIIANSGAKVQVYDRAVKDGDTLNIDYTGYVDGVAFEGGSTQGAGTDVTIGVTNYIDGFLEQLIGHIPGENFDIEVTFPENYGKEELNGKDAIFNITINCILEPNTEAGLTPDLAAMYGYESVEELTAAIEEFVLSRSRENFVTAVYDGAEIAALPASVIENLENYIKFNVEMNYGVDFNTYCTYYGVDGEEYLAEGVNSLARDFLCAMAIAEIEGLEVTEQDIEDGQFEEAVEVFGMPYVKRYILVNDTVPSFIIDNATQG